MATGAIGEVEPVYIENGEPWELALIVILTVKTREVVQCVGCSLTVPRSQDLIRRDINHGQQMPVTSARKRRQEEPKAILSYIVSFEASPGSMRSSPTPRKYHHNQLLFKM